MVGLFSREVQFFGAFILYLHFCRLTGLMVVDLRVLIKLTILKTVDKYLMR